MLNPFKRRKPKKSSKPFAGQKVAFPLPSGESTRAKGVPRWRNPLTEKLDSEAYKHIRLTEVTAQPLSKFSELVAEFSLVVESADPAVARLVQTQVIDRMVGQSDMVKWLANARVEGTSFYAIDHYLDDTSGWFIPVLDDGGRRKVTAGGNLEWDGENVYKAREYETYATAEDKAEATLDRWRFVVFNPGGEPSPEGSYELAWRGYNFVTEYSNVVVSLREYTKRFGNSFAWLHENLEHVDAQSYSSRKEDIARQFSNAPSEGFLSESLIKAVEIIEPSGSTSTFLLDYRQRLRDEANRWMLGQDLTSSTASAGPTGSSGEAKDTEAKIVRSFATSLSDALNRDLGNFIRRFNPHFLKGKAPFVLKLVPPKSTKAATIPDVLAAINAGIPLNADFVYETLGTERPETAPDVIEKAPAPNPAESLLGALGYGGNPDPKACCGEVTSLATGRKAGIRRIGGKHRSDIEAMIQAFEKEAAAEMALTWRSILGQHFVGTSGAKISKALISTVSKARGIAYLGGLVKIASQYKIETSTIGTPVSKAMEAVIPKVIEKQVNQAVMEAAELLTVPKPMAEKILRKVRENEVAVIKPLSDKLNKRAAGIKQQYDIAKYREQREATAKGLKPPVRRSEEDFVKFANKIDPEVSKGSARALFRNETAEAYKQGADEAMERVAPFAGGWQYHSAGDGAVRPSHQLLDGVVFPISFKKLMPPFAFNCRCTFTIVPKEMADKVVTETEAKLLHQQVLLMDEGVL